MNPSQISNTAAFIAVKFYGLTRRPEFRSLFDENVVHFYEKLVRSLPWPSGAYHKFLKNRWARRFFIFWEEKLLPGDLMHVLMRKRYLQQMISDTRDNYMQLVVIGAGFDHLATLQSQHGINAFEFDVPRMIETKRRFAEQHNYQNEHLHFSKAFFSRDSLLETLRDEPRLDPRKKTIIVAEGLFDYLDEADASAMLNEINQYFEAPTALFSTIFALEELSPFYAFIYDKSIKLAGEELKLHMNRTQFSRFLAHHGFVIDDCISYSEMEEELLKPRGISMPVLHGFYLLRAHKK